MYLSELALSQFFLKGELLPGELSEGWVSASEQIDVNCSYGVGAAVWGLLQADDVCLCIVGGALWGTGCKGSTGGAWSWKNNNKKKVMEGPFRASKSRRIFAHCVLSHRGLRWAVQTRAVSWWGARAPGSRHRGGRFSRRWSWRWIRRRWSGRSGGRRRPESGTPGGLWVLHLVCGGTPEDAGVWEFSLTCKATIPHKPN